MKPLLSYNFWGKSYHHGDSSSISVKTEGLQTINSHLPLSIFFISIHLYSLNNRQKTYFRGTSLYLCSHNDKQFYFQFLIFCNFKPLFVHNIINMIQYIIRNCKNIISYIFCVMLFTNFPYCIGYRNIGYLYITLFYIVSKTCLLN